MLQLKEIVKNYCTGDQTVEALKGVSLSFRKSEFVAILGPSGCGKTTLLNIVGGLDRYTSGDIVINGVSTRLYDDGDWDAYRNHSIGFIFQSYNLIPHQTILENVELALTLSGVPSKERKKRAEDALKKVGLGDKINKLPAQLSGGQMQRVAIARAIVNDPDIILADEPTGALDTETSIQVMDILRELSKDRLIVMVTHNPDLASEYATRIIRLKDGRVREDTNPFEYTEQDKNVERENTERNKAANKKPSMSLKTALSLSLKNLATKKARTLLTSFAGSIGIIGIALILSLSTGFNTYIANVQRDTLSNYPVKISSNEFSMTGFVTSFMGSSKKSEGTKYPDDGKVNSSKMFNGMLDSLTSSVNSNNLGDFKKYLDSHPELIDPEKISSVNYSYDFPLKLYQKEGSGSDEHYKQVNHIGDMSNYMSSEVQAVFESYYDGFKSYMESSGTWGELAGNPDLIRAQYDVLAGTFENEASTDDKGEYYPLTIVVDEYNNIPDYSLYMMGVMTDEEVRYMFAEMAYTFRYKMQGKENYQEELEAKLKEDFKDTLPDGIRREFAFDDLTGREFNVLSEGDFYLPDGQKELPISYRLSPGSSDYSAEKKVLYNKYRLAADDELTESFYNKKFTKTATYEPIRLKVTSVIRLKKSVSDGALSRYIYYSPEFTKRMIRHLNETPATRDQLAYASDDELTATYNNCALSEVEKSEKYSFNVLTGTVEKTSLLSQTNAKLGIVNEEEPSAISFYPTSFENKDYVIKIINDYNAGLTESGKIQYTDYIGMMVSSVTTIVNAISYVLIAFVSISLIVSSIMIGVITYISVLERTKEIGILRSLGASKRDVGRVFNAETMIIGFASGLMGIIITLILDIPVSLIINSLAGIPNVASLPILGAILLITISVVLTLVAGIIPSRFASTRDPVIALRSE